MLFYLGALGIVAVGWVILSIFVPTASVVNISVFGLLTFIVVLISVRHSYYERNRKKEMYFAISLIFFYYLRSYIRTFIMGGYNALFGIVLTQTNNRGITRINIDNSSWKLDRTGSTIFDMLIFFVGVFAAYVFTESMAGSKGKDIFGAVLAGLNATLFMAFTYVLLLPYLGNVYNTNVLEGASIKLPSVELPTLRVRGQPANQSPLPGWETWLPLLVVAIVIFYFLFFVKPFTKGKPAQANKRDTFTILLVAVLLAVALIVIVFKPTA